MKIAILTEYYPDRLDPGSGAYVHARARGYVRAGHAVRVHLVRAGADQEIRLDDVSTFRGSAESVREELAAWSPDVVAVHTPHPSAAHTRLAASLPYRRVIWVHGYEALFTAFHGYHRGLARVLSVFHDTRKLWRLRRLLADGAAVVFVSEWLRQTARRNLRFEHPRSEVIPNPVDVELFRPLATRQSADKPRGLALRALLPQYGLDIAVTGFAGLVGTELVIVGRGPEAGRLRALAERGTAPVTLEERAVPHDSVPDLMSAFDYFVSPVRTETQGLTMCEAMACGLPVVASRVGGIPEFVRDGEEGYLVPVGRPEELRGAVLRLLADEARRHRMGANARKRIETTCAATIVTAKELALLEAVAS